MAILTVRNVGKEYPVRRGTGMRTKEMLGRILRRHRVRKFWALKDINLEVRAGQSLGIIGPNGSGKSTLLRVIAGITAPTEGQVTVQGRVASLLELGAGFHPFLTGRENVYLNGALLGIKKGRITRDFDKIVEFSGIEEFVDVPVKDYSSGMYVRLAFSVAIHSDPDIFLVDEVLAVGDEEFQLQCRERIRELQQAGKTIVFVSHDLAQVSEICDELVLLKEGKMVRYGDADTTINYYLQTVGDQRGIATVRRGELEAVFNNGRLSLFWQDKPLTKRTGCYASELYRGGWHETTHATWEVAQSSPTEFTALGTAWRLPLEYRWTARLVSDRAIDISIEMRADRRIELEKKHVSCMLRPEFSRWATAFEEGVFEKRQPGDKDWHPLTVASETSEFLAAYGEDEHVPVIIEKIIERAPTDISLILNSSYVIDAGILQTAGDFTPEELDRMEQAEFHSMSRIEITVEEDLSALHKLIADAVAARSVEAGDLRAFFDRGRLRLLWRDTEFTRDMCAYTSVFSGGIWHDSALLKFDTRRSDDRTLIVEGRMRRIPVTQRWTVRAEADGTIAWSIDFIVYERVEIAEWHASVLVVPEYDRWSTPHETGVFPEITKDQDDWIHVNRIIKPGTWIAAETDAGGLPHRVCFDFEDSGQNRLPAAINTNWVSGSRALQSLEVRSGAHRILPPGDHRAFTGRITVTGPEDDIDPAQGTQQSALPFD